MTGIDVEHFRARVLQDALAEVCASYWHCRAEDFERARSRPNDSLGQATPKLIAAADARLTAQAQACRARASLALLDDTSELVDDVLAEEATW